MRSIAEHPVTVYVPLLGCAQGVQDLAVKERPTGSNWLAFFHGVNGQICEILTTDIKTRYCLLYI